MPLPKVWTHARHPPRIRRLRVPVDNVSGLTHHPNIFVYVGLEDHPVEQSCQDTQRRLELLQPGRGDKAIIDVK